MLPVNFRYFFVAYQLIGKKKMKNLGEKKGKKACPWQKRIFCQYSKVGTS